MAVQAQLVGQLTSPVRHAVDARWRKACSADTRDDNLRLRGINP
jgi:hypothetical protein